MEMVLHVYLEDAMPRLVNIRFEGLQQLGTSAWPTFGHAACMALANVIALRLPLKKDYVLNELSQVAIDQSLSELIKLQLSPRISSRLRILALNRGLEVSIAQEDQNFVDAPSPINS